jgi:hypothetical protein
MGNLVDREGCAPRGRYGGGAEAEPVRAAAPEKVSTLALGAAAGAAQGREPTDEVALDALKEVVPVLPAHRCVAPKGDVRHALGEGLDATGELVAGLVGIDRGDDGARRRYTRKDPPEKFELLDAWRAGGA